MRRPGLGMLGCLVGAGLIVTGVSPVWAAEGEPPGGAALVGAFGLGDGLEGSFDEQTGAFKFAVPAGGVNLGWDSRALGANRHGLGAGWSFGLAAIELDGGVIVYPAAGGAYSADVSSSSGLAGYTLGDVKFEQTPGGVLEAREDGLRRETDYAYVLHELGGTTTYFSAAGDPVAEIGPHGGRSDWVWAEAGAHQLAELIDADGVVTELTWNLDDGELRIQPGANLAEPAEPWLVLVQSGRVTETVDPEGARTEIRSSASGLVTGVAGPSGAQTDVQWRSHLDGVARVERVRTLDAVGTELSSRTWRPVAEQGLSTGWPVSEAAVDQPGTGSAFASVISDGKTEVESTYNALGSLIRRVTSGTTPAGRVVLKEQAFQYPGTDENGTPNLAADQLPKHWANPVQAVATVHDAAGGERAATLHTEFDELGRLTRDVDGTTFDYDAADRVISRTTADGAITRTSYWADGARRALTAVDGDGDGDGDDRASSTFYWDDDTLVNDAYTGSGRGDSGTGSYLIGAIRHARTVTSDGPDEPAHQTRYLGTDRHGNTTDLTDERGEVTAWYTYTDYGVTTERRLDEPSAHAAGEAPARAVGDATRNPFQYAAGQTDPSGDQHLRTRLYDARTMRFTTPDPAPMLTDYGYAGLNPITNVDPSGRAEIGDHLVNGVLIGVALIAGFFTATSVGLPTGGMSYGAYAAWAVGAFSVVGDIASTGIAIAQIVHDVGVRFMNDDQREILHISGIVIGAVSALAGPVASVIKRRYAVEDENAWNVAFNNPNQKLDPSPMRPHQLEDLMPTHIVRLFSKKFQLHIDGISQHFAYSKLELSAFAKSFETQEMEQLKVWDRWFEQTADFDFNFSEITGFALNDLRSPVPITGARAAKKTVDTAIKAIREDKKTVDEALLKMQVYRDAPRAGVSLFPGE